MSIYFKDGVYVTVNDGSAKNDMYIYNFYHKNSASLYGGRVILSWKQNIGTALDIDGIPIVRIDKAYIAKGLPIEEITTHLNAIEANGVDAFLEHYKKSIEFLYDKLEEFSIKRIDEISNTKEESIAKRLISELNQIRDSLYSLIAILFSLSKYMSAGLDNEKLNSVYQSVIDLLG